MSKLDDTKIILKELGLPKRQQNDRSAYVLLSLLGLKEEDNFKNSTNKLMRIHDIMQFIDENYKLTYAENTRESIRKSTIHQLIQASIVEKNADDPERPTNSGKTVYSITHEILNLIKAFNTPRWNSRLEEYKRENISLIQKYERKRNLLKIPVKLDNQILNFSPGKHNKLQKLIIEEFAPRFAQGAEILYVGDTAKKDLIRKEDKLKKLGIPITKHSKLPDVVLYVKEKDWLYLIEAVTSVGPISPKRMIELEDMLKDCHSGKIYVTSFLKQDNVFKKFFTDIAWETEIWIADKPDHLIHLNGDRFMGPR